MAADVSFSSAHATRYNDARVRGRAHSSGTVVTCNSCIEHCAYVRCAMIEQKEQCPTV